MMDGLYSKNTNYMVSSFFNQSERTYLHNFELNFITIFINKHE